MTTGKDLISRKAQIDIAMLQSMANSFRARVDFSFNPDDMADLLDRCAALRPLTTAPEVDDDSDARDATPEEETMLQNILAMRARVAKLEAERNALVAGAYDAAAKLCDDAKLCGGEYDRDLEEEISKLTPDDAKAALDRLIAEGVLAASPKGEPVAWEVQFAIVCDHAAGLTSAIAVAHTEAEAIEDVRAHLSARNPRCTLSTPRATRCSVEKRA